MAERSVCWITAADPRLVADRTGEQRVEAIAALRRLRFTGPEIAELLGMSVSTVSGISTRIRMGGSGRLGLKPAERCERERPGELVHTVPPSTPSPAARSACDTCARALTDPRPTARRALDPHHARRAGPTARSTAQAENAPQLLTAGITTAANLTAPPASRS
jgi:hypothetical protein